jgi:hypothetical protein
LITPNDDDDYYDNDDGEDDDIFNLKWVDTRWQSYSTHLHTNNETEYTEMNIHKNMNTYPNKRTHKITIKIHNITTRIYNVKIKIYNKN